MYRPEHVDTWRRIVAFAHEHSGCAGRADLCALARPHLYDPHWTLHAAAEQDSAGEGISWAVQYRAGSRKPPTGRGDGIRKELQRSFDPVDGGPPAFEPDPPEVLTAPEGWS